MKTSHFARALPIAIACALPWSIRARAEKTVIVTDEGETEATGPSHTMMTSGILTFGVAYGAAAGVALTSDRPADHRMIVPLVGPWLALANRGDCGGLTGRSCDREATYDVLIVADGIIQALGALTFVGAFLSPERRAVARTETKPTVHVAPTTVGAGYGLAAFGTF